MGERLACARHSRRGDPPGLHEQLCFWWSDGSRYRLQAPADALRVPAEARPTGRGKDRSRNVAWQVRLTDVVVDAAAIAVRNRCVIGARQGWPGYLGSGTAMGRQRAQLVAELGPSCGACRRRPGTVVDHDHFTGLVRGLLCVHCNTWIDRCPHLTGCVWGDYLNHPPTAHLRLAYLRPERVGRSDRAAQKIDYLGFDPLYHGAADHRRRYPPRQLLPPPPHSTTTSYTSEAVPLF